MEVSDLEGLADYAKARRKNIVWLGKIEGCDLCGRTLAQDGYFIDGMLRGQSAWANMCPKCFGTHGTGRIAWGEGQLYKLIEGDHWLCIAGFQ